MIFPFSPSVSALRRRKKEWLGRLEYGEHGTHTDFRQGVAEEGRATECACGTGHEQT